MAFATRLPKVRDHSEHFNERTWMCYHQVPPLVRVVAHVGDAGQAKPHLEHNPLSRLGTCHATPIRKLNDPDGFSAVKTIGLTPEGPQFGPPGYEINLLYIAGLVALILGGAGPLSIEALRSRRR